MVGTGYGALYEAQTNTTFAPSRVFTVNDENTDVWTELLHDGTFTSSLTYDPQSFQVLFHCMLGVSSSFNVSMLILCHGISIRFVTSGWN